MPKQVFKMSTLSKLTPILLSLFVSLTLTACLDNNEQTQGASTSDTNTAHKNSKIAAPNFTLANIKGGKISLDEYKEQVVLVNFWATWCPPCRAEIPEFIEAYNETSNKGFTVIGIALDQKELIEEFVNDFGVSYPIAYGNEDVSETSLKYGNTMGALPYNVVLNRKHEIVYAKPGPLSKKHLHSLIDPLL